MIKNILVPLDGSDHSKAAVDYAVWITEKFNGMLLGQHIIDTISIEGTFFHDISGSLGFEPYLDFSSKMREILEERGKAILDDFASRCEKRHVRYTTFLDMGLIANEICERSKVADLVVIGHRGVSFVACEHGRVIIALVRDSKRVQQRVHIRHAPALRDRQSRLW